MSDVAFLFGEEPPAMTVICDHVVDPDPEGRLWFSIVFTDAPENAADATDPEFVCLDCVVEEHPEIGAALDMAREHGCAMRDIETGEWLPDPGYWLAD